MSTGSRAGTKGVPREEREQQILDVATAEFGRRGYAAASVADIAVAAGVSKPLVYTYFGSRDGLHAACLERAANRLLPAVAEAQSAPGPVRALTTLTAIFTALDGHIEDWQVIYDPTLPRPGEAHDRARVHQKALNAMGSQGVADVLGTATAEEPAGLTAPEDGDDHSLLLTWWFAIVSSTVSWWADHPEQTAQQMTERCMRVLGSLTSHPSLRTPPSM